MLRDGTYCEAKDLKPNDSLMPSYTKISDGVKDKNLKGYMQILQPNKTEWQYVHHLSDKWNLEEGIYEESKGRVRHHKDFNKLNNNPDNIVRLGWEEHWKLHYKLASWRHKNDPEYVKKIAAGRKKFLDENKELLADRARKLNKVLWSDPEFRKRAAERMKDLWSNPEYEKSMKQLSSKRLKLLWEKDSYRSKMSKLKSAELKKKWLNDEYRKIMQIHMRIISQKIWSDPKHREYISKLMKEKAKDPKWRRDISNRSKAQWQDPVYRQKFSVTHFSNMAKELWKDDSIREMHSKKASLQWNDPSFGTKVIASISKSNRERMEKDPDYMRNLTRKKILSYVSTLSTQYKLITPAIYESERKNNGIGTPHLFKALEYFSSFDEIVTEAKTYNHKVLSVISVHDREDVYDITIDKRHNFALAAGVFVHNSVDGDPAAAMRYTEVRLAKISAPLISDIEKETVDFTDNFDSTLKEPSFLPALLPNLLLMGSEGIAVGMATKIPPHNLSEVVDGVIAAIKKGKNTISEEDHLKEAEFYINKINLIAGNAKEKFTEEELRPKQVGFDSEITSAELVEYIPGPDFPTGGAIYDAKSLVEVYETGRGRIVVRGIADITDGPKGKTQIVITEIPYQVNKAILVEQIADLVKNKKIVGISGLRDESDKDGLRVVADLKRDAKPKSVLNNLYKHTRLQTTFSANFVALVDGTPYTVNLKQIIVEYVRHRQRVIIRRTIFELTGAKKRAHILEGLKIALDHLDEVIKTIRASKTQEEAKNNLMEKFKFSEIQATAILDMQLRRLAALEREKIEKEYAEMMKLIDKLTAILKDPKQVLHIIETELIEVKEKFGDKRKTKIYKQKIGEITEADLIAKEETLITITKTGYIKRLSSSSFKSQHRGGKGVVGMGTKEEDEIEHLLSATTHDMILFFTDKGRVFGTKAWDIAEGTRQSKGQALVNLINLDQGEEIKSILPLNGEAKHLIMATAKGVVKKTNVSEFTNLRANGLIAIKLDKSDTLVSVHATSGDDFVLMLTKNGKSIKFPEGNVRSMGRATTGVRGMRLASDDLLIGMEVFPAKEPKVEDGRKKVFKHILTISNNGLGKRTKVDLFPTQKRGGSGVKAVTISAKTGPLASANMVTNSISQIIITSKHGQVVKLALKDVPELGRATQGVILMRFAKKGDSVAAVTTLTKSGGDEE